MSGHSDDPLLEESNRFFTFFNLSMILVAITGIEVVIIYIETFEGSYIIGVLFATSIIKFIGVIWWFMHLRWDKILNTILFLMGLVIALATFFAVVYMADTHPEISAFEVKIIKEEWKPGHDYKKDDYVTHEGSFFVANLDHRSTETFSDSIDSLGLVWTVIKPNKIPHQFSWKVSHGDLIEINSKKDGLVFFERVLDSEQENIVGDCVYLLDQEASATDFRIKVRSESYWTDTVMSN
ncbi:MAG: hypothetical protein CMI29_09540 [Opitutae bacterium]|nr:hypothetical protein [Opitutae bacterium]|tara:strand:+ start:3240 stop:3953 length:714 start_codon:yes stop_codon:yes gene_type:complete